MPNTFDGYSRNADPNCISPDGCCNCLLRRAVIGISAFMRAKLVSLLLLFAVLIGTAVMPETSHAEGMLAGHSSEVLNLEDHVDAATADRGKQGSDVPCHAIVHHHCSIAIKAEVVSAGLTQWSPASLVTPQAVSPLNSLAMAPPTQPPAA